MLQIILQLLFPSALRFGIDMLESWFFGVHYLMLADCGAYFLLSYGICDLVQTGDVCVFVKEYHQKDSPLLGRSFLYLKERMISK